MGQYVLRIDPKISNSEERDALQAIIDHYYSLPGAEDYLNMPTRSGGTYIVSTRPEAFTPGNKDAITQRQALGATFRGFTQGASNNLPKVTYLNLDSDKDPLRVLVHEIGHIKWPGYASPDPDREHSPEFYKLLGDTLTRFGLEPNDKDVQGVDISKVPSPAGDTDPRFFNVPPPRTIVPKRSGNPDFAPNGANLNLPYYGVQPDTNYGSDAGSLQLYGLNGVRNALLGSQIGYVPGPNPFNPGGLLEQGYVPQPDAASSTNALAAFANPNSGRFNRNALIGPVY